MNIAFVSDIKGIGKTTLMSLVAISFLYKKSNSGNLLSPKILNVLDLDLERESLDDFNKNHNVPTTIKDISLKISDTMKIREKNNLEVINCISNKEDILPTLNNRNTINLIDLGGGLERLQIGVMKESDIIIVLTDNSKETASKIYRYCEELKSKNITNIVVLCNQFVDSPETLSKEDMYETFKEHNYLVNCEVPKKATFKRVDKNCMTDYDKYKRGGLIARGLYRTERYVDSLRDIVFLLAKYNHEYPDTKELVNKVLNQVKQ